MQINIRTLASLLAFNLLITFSVAAYAQTDPSPPPKISDAKPADVTVIGKRLEQPNETPRDRAFAYVQRHGQLARSGQLARWMDEICVTTDGLPPNYNSFVKQRLIEIARNIRVPVSSNPKCQPNIEVFFTPEPIKFIRLVTERNPDFLGYHLVSDVQKLTTYNRPAQAWYRTETKNDRGDIMVDIMNNTNIDGRSPYKNISMPSGCAHSRLTECISSKMFNALILVNSNDVVGKEIGSVADYIGMLAFSELKGLDDCEDQSTILSLFVPGCTGSAKKLTASDLEYLKALYTTNLEMGLTIEKNSIADIAAKGAKSTPNPQ